MILPSELVLARRKCHLSPPDSQNLRAWCQMLCVCQLVSQCFMGSQSLLTYAWHYGFYKQEYASVLESLTHLLCLFVYCFWIALYLHDSLRLLWCSDILSGRELLSQILAFLSALLPFCQTVTVKVQFVGPDFSRGHCLSIRNHPWLGGTFSCVVSSRETLLCPLLVTSGEVVINAINLGKDSLGATLISVANSLRGYWTSTWY